MDFGSAGGDGGGAIRDALADGGGGVGDALGDGDRRGGHGGLIGFLLAVGASVGALSLSRGSK